MHNAAIWIFNFQRIMAKPQDEKFCAPPKKRPRRKKERTFIIAFFWKMISLHKPFCTKARRETNKELKCMYERSIHFVIKSAIILQLLKGKDSTKVTWRSGGRRQKTRNLSLGWFMGYVGSWKGAGRVIKVNLQRIFQALKILVICLCCQQIALWRLWIFTK